MDYNNSFLLELVYYAILLVILRGFNSRAIGLPLSHTRQKEIQTEFESGPELGTSNSNLPRDDHQQPQPSVSFQFLFPFLLLEHR